MAGGSRSKMKQVWLRCKGCGNETMIWRRQSNLKEPAHIKHLWCVKCRDRTAHVELRK